jgi:hypothetical protein
MFLMRHTWIPFDWRRWCCTGMLVLGVPGMLAGMSAGSRLAVALAKSPWVSPSAAVLIDNALMLLGMCAGMWLPHALELTVPFGKRPERPRKRNLTEFMKTT